MSVARGHACFLLAGSLCMALKGLMTPGLTGLALSFPSVPSPSGLHPLPLDFTSCV